MKRLGVMFKVIVFCSFLALTPWAHAYLGPGTAGGVVVTIIAIIVALIISLWGIIYYPVKRKLKNIKKHTLDVEAPNDK